MADTLTLEDIGFEFSQPENYEEYQNYFKDLIVPTTKLIEIPDKINNSLLKAYDYSSDLVETNIESIVESIGTFYNNKLDEIKSSIEENLALDPNTTYDIKTTKCEKADDSAKFNGKDETTFISNLQTNYIAPATVANAVKFANKTENEWKDVIAASTVASANNAAKLENRDFATLKNEILNSVDTSSNITLDDVKHKVEDEWTAHKSADADKFAGDSKDDWIDTITKTKVDNASDADTVGTKSFTDIQDEIDSKITTFKSSDDFKNTVKTIKVDNAAKADSATKADDSDKFAGDSKDDWITTIVGTKVSNASNADNADKFGNETTDQWSAKFTTLKNDIEDLVTLENGWTAYKAKTAEKVEYIGDTEVAKFDDHIKKIAGNVISESEFTDIDASKLDGKTYDEIKTDIRDNVTVNNAKNATSAGYAKAAGALTDDNDTEYDFKSLLTTYFGIVTDEFFTYPHNYPDLAESFGPFALGTFLQTINVPNDEECIFEYDEDEDETTFKQFDYINPDSLLNGASAKSYEYTNGKISKVKYSDFSSNKNNFVIKEFTYSGDKITQEDITFTLFFNAEESGDVEKTEIKFQKKFTYSGNTISSSTSTLVSITDYTKE